MDPSKCGLFCCSCHIPPYSCFYKTGIFQQNIHEIVYLIFLENSLGHNSHSAVIKGSGTSLLHPFVPTNSFSVPIGNKLENNLSQANAKCTSFYHFSLSKILAQYYINSDLFQIVFTIFVIVYTYLNTSKTQEFQVKYTGTGISSASLSKCQNHQSCMFNETMPLTANRQATQNIYIMFLK